MRYLVLRGHGYAQLGFIVKGELLDKRSPSLTEKPTPVFRELIRNMNPETAYFYLLDVMETDIRNGLLRKSQIILTDEINRVFYSESALDYCDERAYNGRYYNWNNLTIVCNDDSSPNWELTHTEIAEIYYTIPAFFLDLMSHNSAYNGYYVAFGNPNPAKIAVYNPNNRLLFSGAYDNTAKQMNLYPPKRA